MNKNALRKSVVALLCLGFILMIVPTVNSAERKAPKANVIQLLRLPSLLMSSGISSMTAIVEIGSISATPAKGPFDGKVKPTDDIQIPKPGLGD
jgi:hypothetical protein